MTRNRRGGGGIHSLQFVDEIRRMLVLCAQIEACLLFMPCVYFMLMFGKLEQIDYKK